MALNGGPTKVEMVFIDHSRELSRTSFHLPYIQDDGSDAPTVATDVASAYALVKAAIDAATLCNHKQSNLIAFSEMSSAVIPSSVNAQRETGLWVEYQDDVNFKFYSLTIPGPDFSLFAQANTDEVDIAANVAAIALKAVLDAQLVSELGNSITVVRMRLIGRRN